MKRSKFSEAQIAFVLKQADDGTSVGEVCRKLGVETTTRYDRTARSETNHRYRLCWRQRQMARPDVSALESRQQSAPETGNSSKRSPALIPTDGKLGVMPPARQRA